MSARVLDALMRDFGELRHEPVRKRVRALVGERVIVDSTRALLVYEPRRAVPSYAVPVRDVRGELVAVPPRTAQPAESVGHQMDAPAFNGRLVLDPSIPFTVHTCAGEPLSLRVDGQVLEAVGFMAADPDLAGHVILDFDGFDAWYDEDERVMSHPRDPFHSMEILRSSRHVRVELDGELLAQSERPRLLFEGTVLPLRAYLPREDVLAELRPSAKRSACAYKGEASYWSVFAGGRLHEDIAWSYEAPLREATEIGGLVAFLDERVDLILDGERRPRPRTPWS